MRVKIKSLKRICIVLGIISLFLCVFVLIRNSIAKSKAIDYINENGFYLAEVVAGATQEQVDQIKENLSHINRISKYEYNEEEKVFTLHFEINNAGDISEKYFDSLENSIKNIEYVESVESNIGKILKYYGIYGYKDFIKELENS